MHPVNLRRASPHACHHAPLASSAPNLLPQFYVDSVKGTGAPQELFYTDPEIRKYFKDYITKLATRTNTVTGGGCANCQARRIVGASDALKLALQTALRLQIQIQTFSLPGQRYVDDPTILAWQLGNEV